MAFVDRQKTPASVVAKEAGEIAKFKGLKLNVQAALRIMKQLHIPVKYPYTIMVKMA